MAGRSDPHTGAAALLAAAQTAVEAGGAVPWQRLSVVNGPPALDCAPLLTVHIPDMGPTDTAGAGITASVPPMFRVAHDHTLWTVAYVVTYCDCYPSEAAPSDDAMLDAQAQNVMGAAWAIMNHLYRLQSEGWDMGGSCRGFQFGRATPLAPSGSVHGFTIPIEAEQDGYDTAQEWS